MNTQHLICIVCPNGCELMARASRVDGRDVLVVEGGLCDKGPPWAEQEISNPMRTISSNVLVTGGDMRLVSVRTDRAIPRGMIFGVMDRIKALTLQAPVAIGDVLLEHPCGTSCRIIATRNIRKV